MRLFAVTAVDRVVVGAALDVVGPARPEDPVVTVAAANGVDGLAAHQHVVAVEAVDPVQAPHAADDVGVVR